MTQPIHRVSFELIEDDFLTVQAMANEERISIAQLVRRALALQFFLEEQQSAGGRVLIGTNDGDLRRLVG